MIPNISDFQDLGLQIRVAALMKRAANG